MPTLHIHVINLQRAKLMKFEVFFSRNVREADKHHIAQILDVRITLGTGKYLGLPSLVGQNKKGVFSFIKDRVWKPIQSWSSKSLSRAGREVLIINQWHKLSHLIA